MREGRNNNKGRLLRSARNDRNGGQNDWKRKKICSLLRNTKQTTLNLER